MALLRENPLSIEAVGQIDLDIDREVQTIARKIEEAELARQAWFDKHVRLWRQRLGVRQKKVTPWPGASNDSWPVTDPIIRRWKPGMANLVLRPDPVALFTATNPQHVESAKVAQEFYHWLFTTYMNRTSLTVFELVDNIAQFGVGYTRQGWEYVTERYSRVVRTESLFPGGLEPHLNAANQQIAQQNAQLPENQQQQLLDPLTFVVLRLAQEYGLSPQAPQEAEELQVAASQILEGARYVRIVYQSVVCDKPAWKSVSPLDVIRPPRSEAIEEDEFITLVHRLSRDDIARRAQDGVFYPDAAKEVMDKIDRQPGGDFQPGNPAHKQSLLSIFDSVEGVRDSYTENIPLAEVWETYAKIDINGDGIAERVILWYHHGSRTLLSAFEYPYPFREWPITEFSFEHKSRRPYGSRGISEMMSTFQKQTNTLHNARLDAAHILLAPMFKVRALGNNFARNIKFRPGARIPVTDPTDFEPIQMDMRPLVELMREEQLTKTYAEQYVGIFDPSLTQLQGTGRERRTATEVDAVVSQSTEVQSADAALFQLGMSRVHQQLWDLWEEYGPEQIHYMITGYEQPKLAAKKDISGDYDIVPAGSPISTNRALVLARAREMLQYALQDTSLTVNKYEVWKEYFRAHDFQFADRFVRQPEEIQILQQALQTIEKVEREAP